MSKEKFCFVIMPISDHFDYKEGHFSRVYEHLIFPACERAGFISIRADDILNTNYIAIDIIKRIIESDMVMCDLSSQNPNVLYELGIRQAFNKPVALIKDRKTKRTFDIQGFRDLEYDENLRVDNVQEDIDALAEVIKSTYENDGETINSLISILSISPAKIDKSTEISKDTELILNSLSNLEKRIGSLEDNKSISSHEAKVIEPYKFYGGGSAVLIDKSVGEKLTINELSKLKKGDLVYHSKFGIGEFEKFDGVANNRKGIFTFSGIGRRTLLLGFAQLRRLE
ncbi:MAG: hypothetical protein JXR03_06025 [Cyclobacteriaceae bacterium]